jgi:lactate 2-monooxygenase
MNDRPDYAGYQNEIYLGGLSDQVPEFPLAISDLERTARDAMSAEAWGYVAGGAGAEKTVRANLEAFGRWQLVPRMLRDVSKRDLSVTLFGHRFEAPVLLAPVGVQSIVHTDAEPAVARAAARVGIPIVLSSASSTSMEDVAEAAGDSPRWYQLYWPNDEELATSFIKRAENSGYDAIVVTLDVPILAWRPRDLQNAFLPFLKGVGVANYFSDPVFRSALAKSPEEDPQSAVLHWVQVFSDPSRTWDKLAVLRDTTKLPLLMKGILHPDDARRAIDCGMDGVVVSNHGGRQVDGSIAALDALPGVVKAIGDGSTVLFDSGVRTGADALKALALGAGAVLLGRPYIWGLAVGGENGVVQVLRSFLADFDLTMALSGLASLDEADPSILVEAPAGDRR